ncbi:MAG TPA: 6-bladed beta-propeller [Candidatus Limnocylindria bacterium]|nr:6-bladed beta-propeller [Candidatus Limnocylindria bacterium]
MKRAYAAEARVVGQGSFRYRVVPGWGELGDETPVKNCHGLAIDREGHVILLTDHTKNNVIVYDRKGRLVSKWGTSFPGAHGLTLVHEGGREVLYLTDLNTHKVYKCSLDGTILNEWGWPAKSGKYNQEDEYRPSWTLHLPGGDFFVLDGYGRDYVSHYDAQGGWVKIFGGAEGGVTHWGPHGGMMDLRNPKAPALLIAMSDQQYLMRMSLDGRILDRTPLPGGNPRQIRRFGDHFYVAHLGDNWPKDQNCRGFVSVLDTNFRVLSNVAGTPPEYGDDGNLRPMKHLEDVFRHPHDLAVDSEGSLYVAQFSSGQTYPIKLERV